MLPTMLGLADAVLIIGLPVGAEVWQGAELLDSIADNVRMNGSPGHHDGGVLEVQL